MADQQLTKTVLELDLASYADVARVLEENLDVTAVKAFEDQIQSFVDRGLQSVGLKRADVVLGTAGDNAILIFERPKLMHEFARAVHGLTVTHNQSKTVEAAKRWFRMGAVTGTVLILESERRIVGSTVARAVRLEAAAAKGQLIVDIATYNGLPKSLKKCYGIEEVVQGKRDEAFRVRRCTMIPLKEPDSEGTMKERPEPPLMGGLNDQSVRDALRDRDCKRRRAALEEIRRRGPGPVLVEILTSFRADDPDERRAAGAALAAIGAPAIPGLLVALREENVNRNSWMVRLEAAERLGLIGDIKAGKALVEALHDKMSNVRWAAAIALGKLACKSSTGPLINSLKSDPHASVREVAAVSLGLIGEPSAISHLIAALSDNEIGPGSNRRVCDAAIEALERFEIGEAKAAVEQWRRRLLGEEAQGCESAPPTIAASIGVAPCNSHTPEEPDRLGKVRIRLYCGVCANHFFTSPEAILRADDTVRYEDIAESLIVRFPCPRCTGSGSTAPLVVTGVEDRAV
jgi:HEAT repeat protein/class 3 adenylate cyclase